MPSIAPAAAGAIVSLIFPDPGIEVVALVDSRK
jgi:hypothetical protein